MSQSTIMLGQVERTHVVPVQTSEGHLFTAVALYGKEYDSIHLSTLQPRVIERGRMVVASLTAALDALEDAILRRAAVPIALLSPDCVPVESLAPDPVHAADLAPTVPEDDLERVRRLPVRDWDPAA